MFEYRPGSVLRRGRPRFVLPRKDIVETLQLWMKQAPKLNEEERKAAVTAIKYLMMPPIMVDMEQNSL